LGGDELFFDACWDKSPELQAFMKKMGWGTNYSLLESYYETNLLKIVGSLGKRYVVWQEIFDNQVAIDPTTIVAVWKGGNWQSELAAVTARKFQAMLNSPWYMDYIGYGEIWRGYYGAEPLNFTGTKQQKKLVIGGTASLWGEFIDGTNLIARAWPNAAAIAERLWSAETVTNADAAAPRLESLRCLLIRRGLAAQPAVWASPCPDEFAALYAPPW